MSFNRKDLKRFKKAELFELASNNDFGFKALKKMSKIELVDKIFISPTFKTMKDSLEKKPKRVMSEKALAGLKRGRESRGKKDKKINSEVEFYSPQEANVNKKEEKIVISKEEKAADKPLPKVSKPEFIELQVIDAPALQVAIENEGVPYESLKISNEAVLLAQHNSILQKGAELVSGVSGEKKSIITAAKVDRQQKRLEIPLLSSTENIVAEMEQLELMMEETSTPEEQTFLQKVMVALQIDKASLTQSNITGEQTEFSQEVAQIIKNSVSDVGAVVESILDIETSEDEQPSRLNPKSVVPLSQLDNDIITAQLGQDELNIDFKKELETLSRNDLLELASIPSKKKRSGRKDELADHIIAQSLQSNELFKALVGKSEKLRHFVGISKMQTGNLIILKREKEVAKRVEETRQSRQMQHDINNIRIQQGNSSLILESQANLDAQNELNDTVNNRSTSGLSGENTEDLNTQMKLRITN